ncbi:serine/threonine-protein kinase Wnk-like [Armigeres subalbatus]|uniref:serine/threonine-protein kinase Wnk-like n=1 Tax=Armigeres subalbatus TaxID=124917 RepID=UPI002ED28AA9
MKLMRTCLPAVLSMLAVLVASVTGAGGDLSSQQQPNGQKPQTGQKVTDSASASDGTLAKAIINSLDKAQNKRGAPVIPTTIVGTPQHAYINQPVAAGATAGSVVGAAVGPVAYAAYGHPHYHQAGAISSAGNLNAGSHQQLVQQSSAAVAAPQTVYHKINYVAPNSALKVATFAAAPAHYEYGPAVAPTLTKSLQYNYAAAVPQYQYAHFPQTIQVYQHHHHAPGATATIITNDAGHVQYLHHPQQQHQQHQQAATIYTAHQPAAAVHYTLTQPAVQHNYQHQAVVGQQAQAGTIHYHHAQQQQQQPHQTTFVGVQPAVPVVHQAPIAAINQVHQANQVIATQAQLVKYPASPIYATGLQNQLYQHQSANYAPYQVPVAAKQFLSSVATPTVATPSHIKQLIPVTTATTTQHHGKGVSFSTFTQQANAAVLGHHHQNQPPYYNTAVGQPHQYQQQQPQNQAQQQPAAARFQVYSTVATPLHKPTVVYAAQQYAQPSIPAAAIYATAASPLQHQPQSSPFHYGAQLFHPQPPLQQPQPYAQLTKIAYTPGAASLQKGFYPVQ